MRKRDKKREKSYRVAKAAQKALGAAETVSAIFAALVKYGICTVDDLNVMLGFTEDQVRALIAKPMVSYYSDDVTELKKLILTLLVTFGPSNVHVWMHLKSKYLRGRTPVKVFGEHDGPEKVRSAFKAHQDAREGYV